MISPEHMREGRADHSVAWTQFLQNKNENATFCFVEGTEDILYYEPRIHDRFPTHTYTIATCNGKRGVLRVRDLVKEQAPDSKCMYFVDLDFDLPLEDSDVFETSCHSIENLYCTEDSFTRIMVAEFRMNPASSDFARAISMYADRRREYHDCSMAVNAWIALAIRCGHEAKLNLSNMKVDRFVDVELTRVSLKPEAAEVSELFPDCHPVDPNGFKDQLNSFASVEPSCVFRGKFEIQFMIRILRLIKEDITSHQPRFFSQRQRVLLNISDNNLSELSQYAETPDSLKEYIARKYKQFYAAS